VTAYVGAVPSPPQFVGAAKGLVAGITQVNIQVPVTSYSSSTTSVSVNSADATLYVVP
jgi:uncharacterized protein (TIGR03437 family)